jgi:H+-transporting ATPase
MAGARIETKEAEKISADALFERLSSSRKGLSRDEAQKRLARDGYNEIAERKRNPLLKFLGYFWGPIPWMIEVAAVLSAAIRHWEDFGLIVALLALNAVVGFWEEHKADNAIELLKKKLALSARVLRDGGWGEVPARELVPGDVIRVRLGDIVPADIKLLEGEYLLADESALTGESLPVEKHASDLAYSGSVIRQGEMDAMVVTTGMNTFFGKTARLVSEARVESHFQKAVLKIGDYLIVLAFLLVAVIFVVGLFRHESIPEILKFSLVLVVAAIPAALPAVLTVTMAVGAGALAKKEAIISKMTAIEEMAGMDILCSDKTGTITKNELTVAEVKPLAGYKDTDVLMYATLASREEDQDPIDKAVLEKTSGDIKEKVATFRTLSFHPFDPVSKRTEAEFEDASGARSKASKGAPQAVLSLLKDKEAVSKEVEELVNGFASRGYRALGVACTDREGQWQYAGLIALYDAPREDSAGTIETAQTMGVEVKMVTGDHGSIAREIAEQVNMGTDIQLPESFLERPDREARRVVECADGFAQVFPEHKYHIVELLQEGGHIVGMTGDGVNDAPALKKADAGIAVSGATDAAKSAADIVFTKPGLSVIVDAIKESRKIFQRMNNYSIYRIAETIRMLLFITLSILVFKFYPITALMVVLLALLNDAPIMSIAYDNVRYSSRPERWNFRVVLGMSTFLGVIGVISSFGLLYIGQHELSLSREMLQSFIFLKLSVAGHMTVFVARTRGPFWSIKPSPPIVLATTLTQAAATLIVVYGLFVTPIGWRLALIVWGYASLAFVITDFVKVRLYSLLEYEGFISRRRGPAYQRVS